MTCALVLAAAWPGVAAAPQLHITIENGSPYFVPAKARGLGRRADPLG
ncbi:MAG: hypothetical protein KatS3mg082_2162 [Nitrospiraceae bacterium]|nr:MAG: hypothetical protein KatS3mg082_2162 [Nitrospiraceae bacterium]